MSASILSLISLLLITQCDGFALTTPSSSGRAATSSGHHLGPTAYSALTTARHGFSVGQAVESFYQNQPYVSAFVTCSVKASAADFLAQTKTGEPDSEESSAAEVATVVAPNSISSSNSETGIIQQPLGSTDTEASSTAVTVDAKRNIGFLFYGGMYTGICQQLIYTHLFPSIFGGLPFVPSVIAQVTTDMLLVGPLLCLPTAYAVKALFAREPDQSLDHVAQHATESYIHDVQHANLLVKYWSVWTPVQMLTFTVVPSHFRVPFIAAVSFFWMIILSYTAAAGQESNISGRQVEAAALALRSQAQEAVQRKLLEQRLKETAPQLS